MVLVYIVFFRWERIPSFFVPKHFWTCRKGEGIGIYIERCMFSSDSPEGSREEKGRFDHD